MEYGAIQRPETISMFPNKVLRKECFREDSYGNKPLFQGIEQEKNLRKAVLKGFNNMNIQFAAAGTISQRLGNVLDDRIREMNIFPNFIF